MFDGTRALGAFAHGVPLSPGPSLWSAALAAWRRTCVSTASTLRTAREPVTIDIDAGHSCMLRFVHSIWGAGCYNVLFLFLGTHTLRVYADGVPLTPGPSVGSAALA